MERSTYFVYKNLTTILSKPISRNEDSTFMYSVCRPYIGNCGFSSRQALEKTNSDLYDQETQK